MKQSLYEKAFCTNDHDGSARSAEIILGRLFKYFTPESVVDVGCARGAWLRTSLSLGVRRVLGLDGEYVDRKELVIPPEHFVPVDLSEPIRVAERFDLCICMEVAEHLPFRESERFIRDLTRLSDVVLFSAATPYQGGYGHINEQWPEFWALLFRKFGYSAHDPFRKHLWQHKEVLFWYVQNVLVFTRDGSPAATRIPDRVEQGAFLSLTHPVNFLHNITEYRRLQGAGKGDEIWDWYELAFAYSSGGNSVPALRTIATQVEGDKSLSGMDGSVLPAVLNRDAAGPLMLEARAANDFGAASLDESLLPGEFERNTGCVEGLGGQVLPTGGAIGGSGADVRDRALTSRDVCHVCSLLEKCLRQAEIQNSRLYRHNRELSQERAEAVEKTVALMERLLAKEGRVFSLEKELEAARRRSDELREQLQAAERRSDELEGQAAEARELRLMVESFYRSTSWRITAPLRLFARALAGLRSKLVPQPIVDMPSGGEPEPVETAVEKNLRALTDTRANVERVLERDSPAGLVLVVENRVPTPDRNSSSVRLWEILKALVQEKRVIFASSSKAEDYHWVLSDIPSELPAYVQALVELGVGVLFGYEQILEHLKEHGKNYEQVILSYPEIMYQYLPLVRVHCPRAHVIYDTVDLHGVRLEREAQIKGTEELFENARRYRKIENVNLRCADTVIAVTEEERKAVLELVPDARVRVIPNIHEISEDAGLPPEDRSGLLFIGHFLHNPNVDAVEHFVRDIFPLVKERIPTVKFSIIGSVMPESIRRLAGAGVEPIGYVADPTPYFQQSRVFVAPLRFGAGMKGKIGQAMSLGLPVVTTTVGAEGMGLTSGVNVLVADGEEEFADAVCRLYTDVDVWKRLVQEGREHMKRNFSPDTVRREIVEMLKSAGN